MYIVHLIDVDAKLTNYLNRYSREVEEAREEHFATLEECYAFLSKWKNEDYKIYQENEDAVNLIEECDVNFKHTLSGCFWS